MAGAPHDVLLLALKEKPELLSELLRRVTGVQLQGPIQPADSAVRFAVSLESYPDLVFTTPGPDPSWILVEVQNRKDARKARIWHLATSVLLQRHRMGDLIVITASRAVARWAVKVAEHRGDLGTRKGLVPVVLYLSKKDLELLLDPATPELALFAVWARCRGAGAEAEQVARRALEVTEALSPQLQEAQTRAILAMLGERLLESLKERSMDVNQIPETKASREFRLFFENRGRLAEKRAAVLAVLAARGLTPSAAEQARINALTDLDRLDQLLQSAATATTMRQALVALRSRTTGARTTSDRASRIASGSSPRAGGRPAGTASRAKKVNGHDR